MNRNPLAVIGAILLFLLLGAAMAAADDLEQVQKAIEEKGLKWTAGPAYFTEHEFRARLGVRLPLHTNPLLYSEQTESLVDSIPTSWDWRSQNAVSGIRDQQSCGGCWAFAEVGCLESAAIRQGHYPKTIDLSEQVLLSCDDGESGCNGASDMDQPAAFLASVGTVPEACFPFAGYDESCNPCSTWQSQVYKTGNHGTVAQSVSALKTAIYTYGPLVTTFEVYSDFDYYSTGVYSYAWGYAEGGHAVLIVGYNDAGSYFIVKNSWGPTWGLSGYFEMAYSEVGGVTNFGADSQWMDFGSGPDDDDDDNDNDDNDDNDDDNDDDDNDDNDDDDDDDDDDDSADTTCQTVAANLYGSCNESLPDMSGNKVDQAGLVQWCVDSENLFGKSLTSPFWRCMNYCATGRGCDQNCFRACVSPSDPGGSGCAHLVYEIYGCGVVSVFDGTNYWIPEPDAMLACQTDTKTDWDCMRTCVVKYPCSNPATAQQTKVLGECLNACGASSDDDNDDNDDNDSDGNPDDDAAPAAAPVAQTTTTTGCGF